jgi:hypothetical protein
LDGGDDWFGRKKKEELIWSPGSSSIQTVDMEGEIILENFRRRDLINLIIISSSSSSSVNIETTCWWTVSPVWSVAMTSRRSWTTTAREVGVVTSKGGGRGEEEVERR